MFEKPTTYADPYFNENAPPDFLIEEKILCPRCLLDVKYNIEHYTK